MDWTDRLAPSLDDFVALAEHVLGDLPETFRALIGDVVVRVDEFASDAMLEALGIGEPFELTGLYQGVDLSRRSVLDASPQPSMVFLYRRPILDAWSERGDVGLGDLIADVLVHELGKVATVVAAHSAFPSDGWGEIRPPSLADFAEVAERALANLPPAIRAAVADVQIRVEEFADEETLDALEIADAFELTGVYEGVDLTRRSVFDLAPAPPSIRIFRRPILDEWSEGEVGFQSLVEHVLVHEVAHHFGFSDAGIEQVEQS